MFKKKSSLIFVNHSCWIRAFLEQFVFYFVTLYKRGKYIYVIIVTNSQQSNNYVISFNNIQKCMPKLILFAILFLQFRIELLETQLYIFSRIFEDKNIYSIFSSVIVEIPRWIKLLTGIAHLLEESNICQHRKRLFRRRNESFLHRLVWN